MVRLLLFILFYWYPEPEGGALSELALHAYLTIAAIDNGLADREAETRSLYIVVELDEAFEDASELVVGDSCARILAIDVDSPPVVALFQAVAHADVSLMGVFDGIGNEVSDYLLYASLVDADDQRLAGVLTLELNGRLLYALGK